MISGEFVASYRGEQYAVYLAILTTYLTDLGGHLLKTGRMELIADFGGRRIRVRLR